MCGIPSLLSVQINETPAPARGTGRVKVKKVMSDRRFFNKSAPGPPRDVLARPCRLIARSILHGRSVDAIRPALARRRRPSESVSGENKTTLAGPCGDRPLSQGYETGRYLGRLGRGRLDSPTPGAV